jgi:hypothetical protein
MILRCFGYSPFDAAAMALTRGSKPNPAESSRRLFDHFGGIKISSQSPTIPSKFLRILRVWFSRTRERL